MNFPCTTAAFTLSPAPGGLRHLVLTRPGTEPSMRFLSVGSHLCARASSRPPLAGLPLPSASSFICPLGHTGTPTGDFHPISSRPCRAYTIASTRTAKSGASLCFSPPVTRNVQDASAEMITARKCQPANASAAASTASSIHTPRVLPTGAGFGDVGLAAGAGNRR